MVTCQATGNDAIQNMEHIQLDSGRGAIAKWSVLSWVVGGVRSQIQTPTKIALT
ncbi:hypothetical protein [Leptothoe sp. PORK10 BA2]|uniref:hypothetical protein n=1 Tax=Leptothoe sp. PORK10 BA2 TaxID=3110254 RepID=UPI002B1FD145|nr:hypothetical protein [Leptothoe sp. PORK10 BA2]MEA5467194.1 hypothetical protein [Leptothoe sp. PORK10 BA2]